MARFASPSKLLASDSNHPYYPTVGVIISLAFVVLQKILIIGIGLGFSIRICTGMCLQLRICTVSSTNRALALIVL